MSDKLRMRAELDEWITVVGLEVVLKEMSSLCEDRAEKAPVAESRKLWESEAFKLRSTAGRVHRKLKK